VSRQSPEIRLPERSDEEALPDLVYRAILDAMFRGTLKAGDVVSEFALSRALGVSSTPVHAAMRDLAHDGLIVQATGQRPTVATMSAADLREIFEMRMLLEGEAAFRAALLVSRPAISDMSARIERLRAGGKDLLVRWCRFDDAFHQAIARACGNRRLCADVLRYRRVHYALNAIRMAEELIPQALDEHERILLALEARDPDAARAAMVTHLREWQAYYGSLFTEAAPTGRPTAATASGGGSAR